MDIPPKSERDWNTPQEVIAEMVANRKELIASHHAALDHKKGGKAAVDKLASVLERIAQEEDNGGA